MLNKDSIQHRTWHLFFQSPTLPALLSSILLSGQIAYAGNKVVVIPLSFEEQATSKLIFVTNQNWKGKLGGVEGAHAKCALEAKSRGIRGRFHALLGTPAETPVTRSNHYSLKYVRLSDGRTLRSSYHSLFHSLDNPILETGVSAGVWTGLDTDGRPNGMENCQSWTSKSGADFGRVGNATQSNSDWISAADNNCGNSRRLYCIEQ